MAIGLQKPLSLVKALEGDAVLVEVKLNPNLKFEVEAVEFDGKELKYSTGLSKKGASYQGEIVINDSGFHTLWVRFRKQGEKRWRYLTEKTGRKVCRSCPSDVNYMILSLKNLYNMCQFKFKKHSAQYKNMKGDKVTISNATMTDKSAVEFLRTNPERISLFAVYPSNWETLLIPGSKKETKKAKEARLIIEAELKAKADADALKLKNKKSIDGNLSPEEEARRAAEAANGSSIDKLVN